ncbi:ATP-binding protein [Solwaraspora sp. WMMD406]|uniref:ATP-binding protein n=1 Tax=Solwaraspora sp. WMMD406 TaxID=3016095 RepID=UPI002416969F|nr:ATP-binding protein [Solwaraspora sp. WMMD406]MDG4766809.1 ATP-binding protein [Solwaraspora sp. WMMD406]
MAAPARLLRRFGARLSLRTRLTVISVLGVSAGLAAGAVGLSVALAVALDRSADADARTTGEAIAELVAADALPDPLPVAGNEVRVQIVDEQGRVRAASIGADRLVPMLYTAERARLDDGFTRITIPGDRLGLRGPVRVTAVPAGTVADPQTVLVARSIADITRSVTLVRVILLLAFPLLVAGVAALLWRTIGAALRPVEKLRAGAEEITGGEQAGHLPVPEGSDEIQRLAVTLNSMLDRLEAGRARQRAFVADAAHELRSPLASLRTQLEVAQRLGPRTDWSAVAEDLLADSHRLSRLVDDLLLLARADQAGAPGAATGTGVGVLGPVGPIELGELILTVTARYPAPPVRVVAPGQPLWTAGDSDALVRVLANLLDNAVRHADDEVVVAARPGPPGWHELVVTDDGPGVPADDRERVFDRFTRLDDARARDAGGAGLGLAIVRQLVRQHGGTVDLADADADADADAAVEHSAPGAAAGSAARPGLRVRVRLPADLLADDTEDTDDGTDDRVDVDDVGHGPDAAARSVQPAVDAARSVQTGSAAPTRSAE